MSDERRDDRAVYVISIAAELAGVHPQTLRIYERRGLVQPKRTAGNTRRYSERDIARLQLIQELTQAGINLEGVKRILELQNQLDEVRGAMEELEQRVRNGTRTPTAIVRLRDLPRLPWEER